MPLKNRCHHHFIEYEEGIDLLLENVILQKWSDCGHVDTPLDIQEANDKKNYPSSPNQLYFQSFDFI